MVNKFYKNDKFEIILNENNIYIKNYTKIISINNFKIIVSINNKVINILGNNLIIIKLDRYDLAIKGIIKGIEFNEW